LSAPSFDTVIRNYRFCFRSQWRQHSNSLIGVVRGVCHDAFSSCFYRFFKTFFSVLLCSILLVLYVLWTVGLIQMNE